jgi:uncharacterized protein (DUF433 family)
MEFSRITTNPSQMRGVPCVRGLRIPVAIVVAVVAEGQTPEQILALYTDLEAEDIREAVLYAAEAVRERPVPRRGRMRYLVDGALSPALDILLQQAGGTP